MSAVVGSDAGAVSLIPLAKKWNDVPGITPIPPTLHTRSVASVERLVNVTVVVDAPMICVLANRAPRLVLEQRAAGAHTIDDTAVPTVAGPVSVAPYHPSWSVMSRHSPAGTLAWPDEGSPVCSAMDRTAIPGRRNFFPSA